MPRAGELRVLTLNLGLLRKRLFGLWTLFQNPPFADERLPYIIDSIRSIQPPVDVIAIQVTRASA